MQEPQMQLQEQHRHLQSSPEDSLNSTDLDAKNKEDPTLLASVGTLTFISCGAGSEASNEGVPSSPVEKETEGKPSMGSLNVLCFIFVGCYRQLWQVMGLQCYKVRNQNDFFDSKK